MKVNALHYLNPGYVNGLTFVFSSSELSHFGRPNKYVGHLLPKHYR